MNSTARDLRQNPPQGSRGTPRQLSGRTYLFQNQLFLDQAGGYSKAQVNRLFHSRTKKGFLNTVWNGYAGLTL